MAPSTHFEGVDVDTIIDDLRQMDKRILPEQHMEELIARLETLDAEAKEESFMLPRELELILADLYAAQRKIMTFQRMNMQAVMDIERASGKPAVASSEEEESIRQILEEMRKDASVAYARFLDGVRRADAKNEQHARGRDAQNVANIYRQLHGGDDVRRN